MAASSAPSSPLKTRPVQPASTKLSSLGAAGIGNTLVSAVAPTFRRRTAAARKRVGAVRAVSGHASWNAVQAAWGGGRWSSPARALVQPC